MKASLITLGCILLGAAACTAPQGKKISGTGTDGGLAPVASGPTSKAPAMSPAMATTVTSSEAGQSVPIARNGTVTVMLNADPSDGYSWRLSEIPDPSVLRVVSQEFVPGATPEAPGQEKWVFQAVGDGDVAVKMWYGNMRLSSMSGNPNFDFVASVSEPSKPAAKKSRKTRKA
jgi:predicted secreted protein